jgi:small-conductance mechanosensitive channel
MVKAIRIIKRISVLVFFFLSLCISSLLYSQEYSNPSNSNSLSQLNISPVKLDGHILFNVRGVSSFPAERRSREVSERIKKVAANDALQPEMLKIVEENNQSVIYAGNEVIIRIFDADADVEGLDRTLLAETIELSIKSAIERYRHERSRPVVIKNIKHALVATVILIGILIALLWIIGRIDTRLQIRIKKKIESVENVSFNLIKSNQIWRIFHVLIKTLKTVVIVLTIVFFAQYVLSMFPWTNSFSNYTLSLILDPIIGFGTSFLNYIPKLVVLFFIYFITKYVLKLIKLFFVGIEEGGIVLKDFNAEWAMSTFRIVKLFVVAFAIVIAYPYIPGSDSIAFKGVSVFVGILFSLGSSSFIGNIIAGYTMIYRGAFKKGDRIEVDNKIGIVEEQRLMVTRLRSLKNEEIVIPNSTLVNSQIVNYTVNARDLGLIIHTMVGIGYETPWRQVDAMLKLAANRTDGILKNPPPFVLKKALADFAVNYEINGYCSDIDNVNTIYTDLHQNILDVFNENHVQIMTPSYKDDPEIPKLVPKEQWFTPLAKEE